MGLIIHKRGDLFTTTLPIIAHGCNTSNGFASGVAGQVARLHPEVKRAYHGQFTNGRGWSLGDVQVVEIVGHPTLRMVANLATQEHYGRQPGRVYVDYDAVARSFDALLTYSSDLGFDVAMPRIGCGLAGGDWARVEAILRDLVSMHDVVVEVWTP